MKLSVIVLAGLLGSVSTLATAQQPAAGGTTITGQDRALDSRIEKRLANDASLKKYDIKVSVEGGVATLTGTVATEADRTRAAELAKVAGVTRVDNKLVADLDAATKAKGTAGKIGDETKKGAEKTKDAGGKVVDKTKDTGGAVADKTKEGASKTGEAITDGWISTRIKTKFMGDEALRASDIKVDTNDHVVTLTGTVVSPAAHAKAIEMAKEVEGVKRVVDRMKIVPKTP
jgi:hyperosmotically inducible protein